MGKAANNERIKLRAAFYNNLAVAFVVTGVVVPTTGTRCTASLAVTQNKPERQVSKSDHV
jgi:hypothetical protein